MPDGTIESTELNASVGDSQLSSKLDEIVMGASAEDVELSAEISVSGLCAAIDAPAGVSGMRYTSFGIQEGVYIYVFSAPIGSDSADPVWQISRTERVSETKSKTLHADGNYFFDNIADDYATLNYS